MVALAVALAPVLLLSAIQSRSAFLQEERRVEDQLVRTARDSAQAAQSRIDGAVIMLETLRSDPGRRSCGPRLHDLVDERVGYEALVRVSASGRLVCASRATPNVELGSHPWFRRLQDGEGEILAATPSDILSDEPAVLAAVRAERADGAFDGAFVALISVRQLQPRSGQGDANDHVEVALVDALGRILTASDSTAFPLAGVAPRDLTRALTEVHDADGEVRVISAVPFAGRDIFVVASRPSQDLFAWAMGNALAVFILPLLTWLIALVCVFIVTDRVVIRWLAYLERIAAIQARGRRSVRPILAMQAPAEIRNLATAMDEMVQAIEARDASLRESLEEKDALMREIHHRVKNNLQVITSLLNMQQRSLADPSARSALGDTRQRITALSLIYRALYQSDTLKQVDIGAFLRDLVGQLMASDAGRERTINSQVEADTLVVDPDKLAPVALWAVEAISNAQKHAFSGRGGLLTVRFCAGPDESALEIQDDGEGAADGVIGDGLGGTLMNAFARQLRGRSEIETAPGGGVLARLVFPTPEVSLHPLTDSSGRRNQRPA